MKFRDIALGEERSLIHHHPAGRWLIEMHAVLARLAGFHFNR
jgi:hypothetical protein